MSYFELILVSVGCLLLSSCHGEETSWCLNDIKSLIEEKVSSPCLITGITVRNANELHVVIGNINNDRKRTLGGYFVDLKYANKNWSVSSINSYDYPPDHYKGTFLDDKENNWRLSEIHKALRKELTYLRILSICIMSPNELHILVTNMKEITPLGGAGQSAILKYESGKWRIKEVRYWTS